MKGAGLLFSSASGPPKVSEAPLPSEVLNYKLHKFIKPFSLIHVIPLFGNLIKYIKIILHQD